MSNLHEALINFDTQAGRPKQEVVDEIEAAVQAAGYTVAERDDTRPWGAFLRLNDDNADAFVAEFFPGSDALEARLGNPASELSPKILLTLPGQRLSWQYHDRRAERWAFLTDGGFVRSSDDTLRETTEATSGQVVQFEKGERHRLVGALGHYTLVAEIWQHTDSQNPSNEDDIVRVEDDYRRD
jgi:mannose-6-phosphate isomerase